MLNWLASARKAIGATVASAAAVYVAANADGVITAEEWGYVTSSIVVGIITYYLRNREVKDNGDA